MTATTRVLHESAATRPTPHGPSGGRDARAQPPEDPVPLTKDEPAKAAGGIPAVMASIRHALGEAGVVRGTRLLLRLNQFDGYDCPGCAWPDPDERRGSFEFCENGAKAVADEGTRERIGPDFFARHSVADLSRRSDLWLGNRGRLTHPTVLRPGATHYQPLHWDEAFAPIASELHAVTSPDQAVFYTSGRTSNEAAFLYQLFVREYGTNNLPDCSNMCHESSGVALGESLGIGKGSAKLEDLYQAEVIIILGQNPGTNHPRMLTALQKAKANGAIIIAINPLPETGLMGFNNPQTINGLLGRKSGLADLFLPIKINGDMALLQALEILLLQEETRSPGTIFDKNFIAANTDGFDDFIKHLQQLNFDELMRASGI